MNFFESLFLDRKLTGRGMFSTWCKEYEILDLNFLLESGYPSSFSSSKENQNIILRAKELVTSSHPESWWLIDEISTQLKPTWIFLPVESDKPFEANVSRLAQIRSRINSSLGIYWNYSEENKALYINLARQYELPIYLETDRALDLRDEDYQFIHFVEYSPQVTNNIKASVAKSFESAGVSPVFVEGIESASTRSLWDMFPVSLELLPQETAQSLVVEFEKELDGSKEEAEVFSAWPKFVRMSAADFDLDPLFIQAVDLEYSLIQVLRSTSLSGELMSLESTSVKLNPFATVMASELDYRYFFNCWRGIERNKPKLVSGRRVLLGLSKSLDNKIRFTELDEPMAFIMDLVDEGRTSLDEVKSKAGQIFNEDQIKDALIELRSSCLIL